MWLLVAGVGGQPAQRTGHKALPLPLPRAVWSSNLPLLSGSSPLSFGALALSSGRSFLVFTPLGYL